VNSFTDGYKFTHNKTSKKYAGMASGTVTGYSKQPGTAQTKLFPPPAALVKFLPFHAKIPDYRGRS
jgi:hypothetical protein